MMYMSKFVKWFSNILYNFYFQTNIFFSHSDLTDNSTVSFFVSKCATNMSKV